MKITFCHYKGVFGLFASYVVDSSFKSRQASLLDYANICIKQLVRMFGFIPKRIKISTEKVKGARKVLVNGYQIIFRAKGKYTNEDDLLTKSVLQQLNFVGIDTSRPICLYITAEGVVESNYKLIDGECIYQE